MLYLYSAENPKFQTRSVYFLFMFNFLPVLFMLSCSAQSSVDLEQQLNSYCHTYLSALSEQYNIQPVDGRTFQINEVFKDRNPVKVVFNFLGNLVSPSSAHIHSAYQCIFQIPIKGIMQKGSMDLILIENESFADYTLWKETQIIDKGEVWSDGVKYYVVVKYLITENGESLIKALKSK